MSQVVIADDPTVLQALLDLADNRKDVQTTMDYGPLAVVIPDELYERYQNYLSLSESESSPPEEPKKRQPRRRYQLPGLE